MSLLPILYAAAVSVMCAHLSHAALIDRCTPAGTSGLRCDLESSLSVSQYIQLAPTEKFSLNFTAAGSEVTYIYEADHDDEMKQSIQCELNDMFRGACAAWGKSTKDLLADGNNVVTQFCVPEDGMHTSMQCIRGSNDTNKCAGRLTTRFDSLTSSALTDALKGAAHTPAALPLDPYTPWEAAVPIARVAPVQLIQLSGTRADPRQSVYVSYRSTVELDLSMYQQFAPAALNRAAMITGTLTVASSGIPIRECMNEPLSTNLNCVFISFAAFCGKKIPGCGLNANETEVDGWRKTPLTVDHTINCTLSLPPQKCNFTYEAVSATGTNDRFFSTATLQLYKLH